MNIKIEKSALNGEAYAPASKSMAHRLLICAGLSEGESQIDNIAYSEDILATLDCLEALGAEIFRGEAFVKVRGVSPLRVKDECLFSARESGSTLRFFIPVALLSDVEHTFKGYGRLMERPMEVYEKICCEKNLLFEKSADAVKVKGKLEGGIFTLRGDVSSQFISGLLFALPLCEKDSEIRLTGTVESRSYINMTIDALDSFGVKVRWIDGKTLSVKGKQRYIPADLTVEGDWSNAAFLDAFNLIGGEVKVKGLKETSLQGDKIYKEYFRLLKEGIPTLDVSDCPDLAPILMTLAFMLNGCTLTGTARLKIKESDRGTVMKEELSKYGAEIEIKENEITVSKGEIQKGDYIFCGHNDHRVVMSLCVLSCACGGEIEGAEAVKKSYPDFFDVLRGIGMEAEIYDH